MIKKISINIFDKIHIFRGEPKNLYWGPTPHTMKSSLSGTNIDGIFLLGAPYHVTKYTGTSVQNVGDSCVEPWSCPIDCQS